MGAYELPGIVVACPSGTTPTTPTPEVRNAKVSRKRFAVDRAATSTRKRKRAKKGTTFSYSLGGVNAATVTYSFERVSKGRKSGKRCVKRTRKNRNRRSCKRYTAVGSFTQAALAGKNSRKFSGKLRGKALKPGSYRVTLEAVAQGKRSRKAQLNFKIVRR
jgi:hypothetical protein